MFHLVHELLVQKIIIIHSKDNNAIINHFPYYFDLQIKRRLIAQDYLGISTKLMYHYHYGHLCLTISKIY